MRGPFGQALPGITQPWPVSGNRPLPILPRHAVSVTVAKVQLENGIARTLHNGDSLAIERPGIAYVLQSPLILDSLGGGLDVEGRAGAIFAALLWPNAVTANHLPKLSIFLDITTTAKVAAALPGRWTSQPR